MHSSQYKILIDSRSKQIFQSVLQPPFVESQKRIDCAEPKFSLPDSW
jgi:hypothetical protein